MYVQLVFCGDALWHSVCGRLGAGTTRLCAGIVSVAKTISIESKMADYSNSLYERLEEETGVKTGG